MSDGKKAAAEGHWDEDLAERREVFGSTEDKRTVNNVMWHEYKVLSENEKMYMKHVKDAGKEFHDILEALGQSEELTTAKIKIREAVMWAVNHITK
jgi:hypothetical protein